MPSYEYEPHNIPKLYNPNATALWCVLFGVPFGAILQGLNWKSLGDEDKAKEHFSWAAVSGGATLLSWFSPLLDVIPSLTWIVLLLVWYYASASEQIALVKERSSISYEKLSLLKPVLYATGVLLTAIGIQLVIK